MSDVIQSVSAMPTSPTDTRSAETAPTGKAEKPRSLFDDAIRELVRRPLFWVSLALVLLILVLAAFPGLFTSVDPRSCQLSDQHLPPSSGHWFGYDFQGCDVYARTIYGARASVTVGFLGVVVTLVLAFVVGMVAGYFGGWIDSLLSRIIDIVLGIPFVLAAVVFAKRFNTDVNSSGMTAVVLAIGLLGWTQAARVVRASVMSAKSQDYVAAAQMIGAGNMRIMWRHILPNVLAPVVVILTIALGTFISAEATLSFLGVGLRPSTISWGIDISQAQLHFRESFWPLICPATFLAVTVLAFIMLGDVIRDAFDPKLR
jgi:oligopeptide transport system permease protein